MSVENKHIIYTAEDIKRYLSGSMAPAEMHAIEMAALDDPLLAEAMQGYEGMEEKDWSKELAALKQKLNTIENSPVVPISQAPAYKWWRAAAAVLLLGTSVVTAYIFTSKKQPEPTPVATVVTGSDSLAVAYADSVSVITNNPTITPGNSIVTTEQAGTAVTLNSDAGNHPALLATTEIKEKADSSFIYRPETSVASYDIKLKDNAISTGDDMESRRSIPEVSTTAPTAANSQYANEATFNNADLQKQNIDKFRNQNNMNVNPGLNYYSGVVLTPDNKAVGYANINTIQNNKPVYTDANGRFKLPSTDSTLKVTVTSAGYNTQHFTLQNSNTLNKIVLQPQEVVTEKIGQSGKKKAFLKRIETLSDTTDEEDYEPSGGWVQYNDYLTNNLVMPNEAKAKNIHGEVEVFVQLKSNGEVSQVKVAKPLCTECDAEAIRLVKEGPKFELKNNKTKKVKVKVKF